MSLFLKSAVASVFALSFQSVFASNPSTGNVKVSSIKVDQFADHKTDALYFYLFEGDLRQSECGVQGRAFAKSGDTNINNLLRMAFMIDETIQVGLTSDCIITTVVLK